MRVSYADIEMLAQQLVTLAVNKRVTISTAESCTGGGIGAALTGVSGASAVFPGGVIAYANAVKVNPLGVNARTLAAQGAVSKAVAGQMAEGALNLFKSDYSVSVTGIAGPLGGTAKKPVGLVYIAIASRDGLDIVREFKFGDIGRANIRLNTIFEALNLLRTNIS